MRISNVSHFFGTLVLGALAAATVVAVMVTPSIARAAEIAIQPAEPNEAVQAEVAPTDRAVVRAPEPDNASNSFVTHTSWESVAANMQSAQTLLAAGDVGEATQQRQREIVAGLEAMIAAAQSASQQQTPRSPTEQGQADNPGGNSTGTDGGTGNPNALESVERHGSESVANPEAAGPRRTAVEEFWGRLPERVRQRVLQSAQTRAVPKYRDAVEEYFQRLLESGDSTNSLRRE